MADTETIKQIAKTADPTPPDRGRTLALAAADEGFQERVQHLLEIMHGAILTEPGKVDEAVKHATTGYAAARLAWEKMRGIING